MATKTKKRRKRTSKKGAALVPRQRKKEVLGLILMALGLLLSLALLTYSAADGALAQAFSLEDALSPGEDRAANALGLVGAALARVLIPGFIGYNALLFTALLGVWGYIVFRNRTPVYLPLLTVLAVVGAFLLASLFGWFALALEQDLHLWSGTWGAGTAGWMQHVFGTVGSFILLVVLIAATILLVIDHDIQRSLDRIEEAFVRLREAVTTWWADAKARHAERRAERQRLLAERRAARAEAREAREQRRSSSARSSSAPAETRGAAPASREAAVPNTAPAPKAAAASPAPAPRAAPEAGRVNDLFRTPTDRPAAPTTRPSAPERTADPRGLELKVRERVEEEKADSIERPAEVPDEDLPYSFPPIDLLDEEDEGGQGIDYEELETNKRILLDKLETYKIQITDINAIVGPTVTLYELTPAPGVKISRITSLEDDLAMAMAARGIRMIAPIPGKSAIGVEIPNRHRELVRIRDVIATAKFRDAQMELPVAIGKSIEGEVFIGDLAKMPHLLIAGATGSGKSVGVNTLIASLLYTCHPANLKFVMIDPKKIELQQYARITDHYIAMPPEAEDPIITDFMQALGVLKSCEKEMERRYDLLSKATVRGIKDYNKKLQQGKLSPDEGHEHLPYIVVIVDELADLMMTAGKDIEGPIARLAQMARAVGIHLVLATQRPSVDVITGLIKANFPSRIAYQVASKVDSRTIMDHNGAEGLVGNGDLLYMNGSRLIRLQGPFVSVDEVDEITHFIGEQPGYGPYALPSLEEESEDTNREAEVLEDTDDLFEEAARIIVRSQQGSVSLLQRKLSVGYTRAARIVDQLEEAGIVGPFEGSKARQVLLDNELDLDAFLNTDSEPPEAAA